MKILIIGGGASGMMAALTASEDPSREIVVAERQARVGRKLLATGNGRCNLSNRAARPDRYHGEQPDFCRYALERFGTEQTLAFFRGLGLLTVTEPSGRIYPYSDSANSVVDVLRLPLEQRKNVTLLTGCEIAALRRESGGFHAEGSDRDIFADRVIVCAGGMAGGKLGGTELGYRLLCGLGHKRTRLYPSLVQIKTDGSFVRSLKGVRCEASVTCCGERRRGELQFTDYGVSGPVIFELSRTASVDGGELLIDFLPDVSDDELTELLMMRRTALPELPAQELLVGMLHNRLGRLLLQAAGCAAQTPCRRLSASELGEIVRAVKRFSLTVRGTMGMEYAQVTAGGLRCDEFDPRTMESRLTPGFYACGEVLDIDGDCGGYNLQWAWASGRLAGQIRSSK